MRSLLVRVVGPATLLAAVAGALSPGLSLRDAAAGVPPPLPGQELGTQPGEVDPGTFASSDVCRNCHWSGAPADGAYMPGDTWAGTMMANSLRDPAFQAALTVANQDLPGIGTFCLRCHAPLSYVRGNATADPSGATSLADPVDGHGVSCEACHRMVEAPPGGEEPFLIGDARIHVDAVTAKRGPYPSCQVTPDDPACSASPGHDTLQSTALASASLCGQCHQASIPGRKLRDARGVATEHDFPLDTTWAEWRSSAYAQPGDDARTCQDCHMADDADGPVCNQFGQAPRQGPGQHAFVGGNHWGIQAVMEAAPERVELYPNAFEVALDRTLATLRAAATIEILDHQMPTEPGGELAVTVRVENLSGHKFPTGYAASRRAWIEVALVPAGGDPIVLLGAYDAATGSLDEAGTRVYRARHGRWNGTEAVADDHMVLHDSVVEDTRIPPRGFVAGPTTTPVGPVDFSDGDGGHRHVDEVTLTAPVPAEAAVGGNGTLRVTLFYQSMTREHVEFLAAENATDDAGERLAAIYEATDAAPPIEVRSGDAEVQLPLGEGGGGGGDAATTAGSGGDAATSTGSTGGVGGGTTIDEESQGASEDDDGCGCRVVGAPRGTRRGALVALTAAAALLARGRRRRAPRGGR